MSEFPVLPESAPFSPAQRAWLNGFFAGLLSQGSAAASAGPTLPAGAPAPAREESAEDWPWHDPTLQLAERTALAAGRPLAAQLMAVMAQLDCGRCGYDCHRYSQAIAGGAEAKLNLCVPGGKETHRALKRLVDEHAPAGGTQRPPAALVLAAASARPVPVSAAALPARPPLVNARLVSSAALNGPGAEKDTRLVVLDLNGSGLTYTPGDSLGIYPENNPALVDSIVAALGADGAEEVTSPAGHAEPLRDSLLRRCDLAACTPALSALLASAARNSGEANTLRGMADQEEVDEPGEMDVLDLLTLFPSARPAPAPFIAALNLLQPRLYSIASSQRVHPAEVHLTVAVLRYRVGQRERQGVASTYLADRAQGQQVPVFVQPAHGFSLPADGAAPVIMVGPGTGIAPFRAFLEERRAVAAKGRNWLFFGNPHRASDFLFEGELEGFRRDGWLARLDTAFSRDQAEKVYVQHAMDTQAAQLWRWLEEGAHVYVCGDAKRMARDVDQALKRIVARQGGLTPEAAAAHMAGLARAGRYQRDVY